MMDHETLVGNFAQSVGVEKAADIVESAAEQVGLEPNSSYTTGEVHDLCDVIRESESGYLALVATEIQAQVQAEERFGALLENIPDPAVVVSFESVDPVVDTVNPAFEETFGVSNAASTGERLDDLIVPQTDAQRAAEVWTVAGDNPRCEVRRRTADGEIRTFLFRPVVIARETGETTGYGIYTDITEREQYERKLEHQNEQLERFVNVVSHDLRNPLNVAAGQTQLAIDLVDDEQVLDRLESVASAHDRMEELIDDLLTLARQGEAVGETSPVDLETLSRESWGEVDTGDASLVVDALPTVVADPSRTRQLFANLFRNAVEHGTAGPASTDHAGSAGADADTGDPVGATDDEAVTVRVTSIDRDLDGSGFAVEDDGIGIPPAERDEVFDQGYSTATSGTGFGLSIVRSIVEAHGWEIELTESADGGARFEVRGVTRYESRRGIEG